MTKMSQRPSTALMKFVKDRFSISLSRNTVCNLMGELKLSRKTCQTRQSTKSLTWEQLKDLYWEFILEMKRKKMFFRDPGLIRSIDVTVHGQPKKKQTTYSPIGSRTMRSKRPVNRYSSSIVTMISADGKNHTPCHLFTHDPAFNPAQPNTPSGLAKMEALKQALESYGISKERIHYVKSDKSYCRESYWMYKTFLSACHFSQEEL